MKTLYQTKATTTGGGRDGGHGSIGDSDLKVEFAPPGSGRPGNNPEQLAALGYSACFASALHAVARRRGVTLTEPRVTVEADLNQEDDGGYALSFRLEAILPGMSDAEAQHLTEAAHGVCPYSKAFRNGAPVQVTGRGG
jgi:lipoyl-dependent peroxiredoxin